jgi:hypothetical protein
MLLEMLLDVVAWLINLKVRGIPLMALAIVAILVMVLAYALHVREPWSVSLCAIPAFVASSLATNYLLIHIPNVKIMDLLVFTSGFCFGGRVGVSVGVLTWVVYGTLNPYGFDPLIWIATMTSESVYGLFGGALRNRLLVQKASLPASLALGGVGFLTTFLYDLATNIAGGIGLSLLYFGKISWLVISSYLIAGIPFALIHEISNTLLFSVGAAPLARYVTRLMARSGVA